MFKLKKQKFSELYSIGSGISSKPEQAGHGTPFLSFSTVFNNYILPDVLPDLMDASEKEQQTYSIKAGDIFLTRTSETLDELGMSSVATQDYPKATFSGFLKRLRPIKEGVTYPKFMAFYLRSKLFRKAMNNNAVMTLRASLNEQIFSYLELFLPPYEIQKSIGDFLYATLEKEKINNRINQELEAMAKLIYDYWFVQFDFPNANGKPYKTTGCKMVYNTDLKKEIPEGWEVKKIGEVSMIKAGGDKPKLYSFNKTEICSIPIYSNGTSEEGLYGYTNEAKINEQSVTISARGTIGYSILRNKPFTPIIRLIVVTPHDLGSAKYFSEYIKTIDFEKSGSVQQQLTVPQVSRLNILYPPKDILKKYETITSPMVSKNEILKEQNQQLADQRDWLLPMLMNGQVTVAEADDRVAMAVEPEAVFGKQGEIGA